MNDTTIKDPAFRVLHTMLRVSDMDRSVDFYTRLLGMRVLEQRQHKKNQFTQTYLGYCEADRGAVIELVFNWTGDEPIILGSAFGHIAIGVYGITALCAKLTEEGVKMPRPPSTSAMAKTSSPSSKTQMDIASSSWSRSARKDRGRKGNGDGGRLKQRVRIGERGRGGACDRPRKRGGPPRRQGGSSRPLDPNSRWANYGV